MSQNVAAIICAAGASIRFGEKKTFKIFRSNPIALIITLIVNGVLIFGDRIKVVILDNQEVNVRASWTGIFGIFLLVIVFQFLISEYTFL